MQSPIPRPHELWTEGPIDDIPASHLDNVIITT